MLNYSKNGLRNGIKIFMALACLWGLYRATQPMVMKLKVESIEPQKRLESTLFPVLHEQPKALVTTTLDLYIPQFASHKLDFRVDDCLLKLSVNGRLVDWKDRSGRNSICWNDHSQAINLKGYLQEGFNQIQVISDNAGGNAGSNIFSSTSTAQFWIFYFSLSIFLILLLGYIWQKVFSHWGETLIVGFWVLLAMIYIFATPWDTRAHDVQGHLDYIRLLLQTGLIPKENACWECFQAPGYYYLGALLLQFFSPLFESIVMNVLLIQLLSVFLMFFFLLGMRKVWKNFDFNNKSIMLLFFLLTTPSFLIHSGRIGNDLLFYTCSIFFLNALLQFWKSDTNSHLRKVMGWLIVCFIAKSTSILLVGVLGITLLFAFPWKDDLLVTLKKERPKTLTLIVGMILVFFVYFQRYFIFGGNFKSFTIQSLNDELKIHPRYYHFLIPDLSGFFSYPSAQPWKETETRNYFWNYFLKSFSYGEFDINNRFNFYIASIRNALMGVIFVSSFVEWYRNKDMLQKAAPLLIFACVLIGGLMAFRIQHSYSTSADARLIYPFSILFISLLWTQSRWLKRAIILANILGFIFWISFFVTGKY